MSAGITLRELQVNLPWTIRYSRDFRANPQSHKDFTHALVHVGKAMGHLFELADDMDHDRAVADDATLRERYGKYVADLVVCALRIANEFPAGVIDLDKAVRNRIETKNGVPALAEFDIPLPEQVPVPVVLDGKVLGTHAHVPGQEPWKPGPV